MREARSLRPQRRRAAALGIACVIVVLAGMVLPTQVFDPWRMVEMSPAEYFSELSRGIGEIAVFLAGGGGEGELVFCSVLLAAMSGGALGMCGSVYQGALRNPLAAPKTLGVMSGGALGALLYYMSPLGQMGPHFVSSSAGGYSFADAAQWLGSLGPLSWFWVVYGKALCSVIGCFAVVACVLVIASATGRGRVSSVSLIITGQIISVGVTSIIMFMRYSLLVQGDTQMSEALMEIENYALGGSYLLTDLLVAGIPLAVCMLAVFLMRNKLTMISFGDEQAQSMGVNVNRWRYIMVAVCTFMVGWAISFCGHIAFLGFISAHVARRAVGPDMRFLLPSSIFVGAMLVTAIYFLTQQGLPFAPGGSVGMYTSIIGAAVFLVMALRQRGRSSGDWQ